jgi:hypothetical protein
LNAVEAQHLFGSHDLSPDNETAHVWLLKTSSINRWSHGRMVPLRLGITLNDCTFACIEFEELAAA